ncbi:acyl-coenzyme A thioesterase PaaI-like protein [Bradyrhizobium sp. LM2.7]
MALAKMSVAELELFLRDEFPQAFSGGDITIESADGQTCLLRQRYSEKMLRPGGTVSGPTLMALADFGMYVVLLSAIGPIGLAVTTNLNINFLRKGQPGRGRARRGPASQARQAPGGRRGKSVVGNVARSDCPCHIDLFHSNCLRFLQVI